MTEEEAAKRLFDLIAEIEQAGHSVFVDIRLLLVGTFHYLESPILRGDSWTWGKES